MANPAKQEPDITVQVTAQTQSSAHSFIPHNIQSPKESVLSIHVGSFLPN